MVGFLYFTHFIYLACPCGGPLNEAGGRKIRAGVQNYLYGNGGKVIKGDTFFGAYFIFIFDLNGYSTFF